jgi:hypothetical protein
MSAATRERAADHAAAAPAADAEPAPPCTVFGCKNRRRRRRDGGFETKCASCIQAALARVRLELGGNPDRRDARARYTKRAIDKRRKAPQATRPERVAPALRADAILDRNAANAARPMRNTNRAAARRKGKTTATTPPKPTVSAKRSAARPTTRAKRRPARS